MVNIVRWGLIAVIMALVLILSGCIQPIAEVDQTRTAQATMGIAPVAPATQPPVQPAAQPTATQPPTVGFDAGAPTATSAPSPDVSEQVRQFIRQRGDAADNLTLWGDQYPGADRLVGFSYTGAAGMSCVGYLLLAPANGAWRSTDSGALTCAATPAIEALVAHTFILTSDGQPNTLVFGRIENPAVTRMQVGFDDGSGQLANVTSGGFMVVKPGVTSPATVTGLDAQNNAVLPDISYSPI